MKTRNVGGGGGDTDFDFSKLPQQKPVNLEKVAGLLNTPVVVANREIEIEGGEDVEDLEVVLSTNLGPEWTRQELPSLGKPYRKFKTVFLKTVSLPVLASLWSAKQNVSYTAMVDALNNCIDVDIRSLTPEDFYFIMYWLRDNSLPRSPMKFNHRTKYGNEIEFNTRLAKMKIVELSVSDEDLKKWRDQGIVFPTVRDVEIINRNINLSEDRKWLLKYAQYIEYIPTPGVTDYSDYAERKIERLEELVRENGLEFLEEIDDFIDATEYGVVETVSIRDHKFDPIVWVEQLEAEARRITDIIKEIPEAEIAAAAPAILRLANDSHVLREEAKSIRLKLEEGIPVVPDEEVVTVSITVTDFFPSIRS